MTKEITYAQAFSAMVALAKGEVTSVNDDVIAKVEKAIERETKKKNSKPTKNQEMNEGIKAIILETLATVSGTVTDIQNANAELKALSNQKVSSILKQMCENDKTVVKVIDKKKSIFFLAEQGESPTPQGERLVIESEVEKWQSI